MPLSHRVTYTPWRFLYNIHGVERTLTEFKVDLMKTLGGVRSNTAFVNPQKWPHYSNLLTSSLQKAFLFESDMTRVSYQFLYMLIHHGAGAAL